LKSVIQEEKTNYGLEKKKSDSIQMHNSFAKMSLLDSLE